MAITVPYPVTQSLAWDPGLGGGAVASFKVICNSVGASGSLPPTQTSYPLSGLNLAPGSSATLAVRADNATGMVTSASIAIQVENPLAAPAAPVNLRIV